MNIARMGLVLRKHTEMFVRPSKILDYETLKSLPLEHVHFIFCRPENRKDGLTK